MQRRSKKEPSKTEGSFLFYNSLLVVGAFSTQGLNMDWTVSIQEIADERKRQVDDHLKERSMEEGAVCKKAPEKSTSEKIIDGILEGTGQAVEDTIDGIVALGK